MQKKKNVAFTQKGVAAIELAFILPILAIFVFGIIDFGRLIQARLVVANVCREGGSLASRSGNWPALITMLQKSGEPLDLAGDLGKIYITEIKAGTSSYYPNPTKTAPTTGGNLAVPSTTTLPKLGLTDAIYYRLTFDVGLGAPFTDGVTVVEVFYKYKPITPLPHFIENILLSDVDGTIIRSRSVF